jgi:hypothetical protein
MLVACRLAGLSALETNYDRVGERTQTGFERPSSLEAET